jgi:hypothetical protein
MNHSLLEDALLRHLAKVCRAWLESANQFNGPGNSSAYAHAARIRYQLLIFFSFRHRHALDLKACASFTEESQLLMNQITCAE